MFEFLVRLAANKSNFMSCYSFQSYTILHNHALYFQTTAFVLLYRIF